jgi:hypothetical protein
MFFCINCKEPIPKIGNKYSKKGNCAATVPISTFMCLWAIYIFPRSKERKKERKIVYFLNTALTFRLHRQANRHGRTILSIHNNLTKWPIGMYSAVPRGSARIETQFGNLEMRMTTSYPLTGLNWLHVCLYFPSLLLGILPSLFWCRKYVDRSWEYINRTQTHKCGN